MQGVISTGVFRNGLFHLWSEVAQSTLYHLKILLPHSVDQACWKRGRGSGENRAVLAKVVAAVFLGFAETYIFPFRRELKTSFANVRRFRGNPDAEGGDWPASRTSPLSLTLPVPRAVLNLHLLPSQQMLVASLFACLGSSCCTSLCQPGLCKRTSPCEFTQRH